MFFIRQSKQKHGKISHVLVYAEMKINIKNKKTEIVIMGLFYALHLTFLRTLTPKVVNINLRELGVLFFIARHLIFVVRVRSLLVTMDSKYFFF